MGVVPTISAEHYCASIRKWQAPPASVLDELERWPLPRAAARLCQALQSRAGSEKARSDLPRLKRLHPAKVYCREDFDRRAIAQSYEHGRALPVCQY